MPQKTGKNREIQIADQGELTTKWNIGSWIGPWNKKKDSSGEMGEI